MRRTGRVARKREIGKPVHEWALESPMGEMG